MMKPVSGHTQLYAVLGHPIGHSLSPVMHNAAMEALGMDALYLAMDAPPDRLMPILQALAAHRFGGVNLTIPLKEVAFENLARLDESAELLGAVNTVVFADEGPCGYNTDGYGFLAAVRDDLDLSTKDRNILVVGAGGAGRAVALVCAREGAASVTVSDLDEYRAENVVQDIHRLKRVEQADTAVGEDALRAAARTADLIVQATPIGMKPDDPSLLPADAFHAGQAVFDLIYMYPETAFLREAAAAGARTAAGLGMLMHQGARAFELWTGVQPPLEVMRDALAKAVYT